MKDTDPRPIVIVPYLTPESLGRCSDEHLAVAAVAARNFAFLLDKERAHRGNPIPIFRTLDNLRDALAAIASCYPETERLRDELARVTAERDAALDAIRDYTEDYLDRPEARAQGTDGYRMSPWSLDDNAGKAEDRLREIAHTNPEKG